MEINTHGFYFTLLFPKFKMLDNPFSKELLTTFEALVKDPPIKLVELLMMLPPLLNN
ncbi:MAG: hypothetical protein ACTHKJ_04015 [Candidatus Nitrosocosmicus sp.]